ncbi:MAG: YigZ family protein [Motiliproteus sp.]|nr:YigZ family protein [Motiliproteus sp.]MCW9051930.1 YigZ family protein [Motiliproteus sp.]
MHNPYSVPQQRIEVETEIKKSRFIAWADRAENRDQAMAVLSEARNRYPDARHHCWAYLIGNPAQPKTQAMSDDGEPSGTAGKPILNVLQHNEIGDVMIVVSRYFGGIKLGAGGLVRLQPIISGSLGGRSHHALPTFSWVSPAVLIFSRSGDPTLARQSSGRGDQWSL